MMWHCCRCAVDCWEHQDVAGPSAEVVAAAWQAAAADAPHRVGPPAAAAAAAAAGRVSGIGATAASQRSGARSLTDIAVPSRARRQPPGSRRGRRMLRWQRTFRRAHVLPRPNVSKQMQVIIVATR